MHNSVALVSAVRMSHWINFRCTSVQFSSDVQSCPILCDPMNCSTPGLPVHHQLPEFTQIHVHRVRDAIQPSHPLLSPSPPAPNPSQHQNLFQWVNSSQPKYWSFSFSIIPSREIPGLISFRMDWLDLLAVQGTLKSLLQHQSSKASLRQCSAFFTVQLSHPYIHPINFGFPSHLCHKSSQVPFFFYFSQNMVVFKIYLGVNYNTILWWFLSSNINKP